MPTDHLLPLQADTRENGALFLESDADEELLITIKFMQAVKIAQLRVVAAIDSLDNAPTKVKLFVNKVGLDFDSAKSDNATQEISLSKEELRSPGKPVSTHFVKFQNVQELGIFVPGNHGDEEQTRIATLAIVGELVAQTGMKRTAEQQASASKGDWLGKGIS